MYAASSRLERALPAAAYVIKEICQRQTRKYIECATGSGRGPHRRVQRGLACQADVDVKAAARRYLKAERDDERIMILIR
jgi:hypothetical protein